MLRIVHVAATPTGAPWMVALMREQKRLGHDVAAILPAIDGSLGKELAALGIPCHAARVDVLFALSVPRKIGALAGLVRLLRRLRPDVVHSHIVNSVITARLASWIADVPMHVGANAHPMSMESDVLRAIEVGTAFCDTVTMPSCTYTRDLMLRHGIPAEQIELVHYAVDQQGHDPALADGGRVRRELGLAASTPVVGKIAYFYPPARSAGVVPVRLEGRGVKGHEVLIRAVPRVLASVPDAAFVLVGRGWGPGGPAYERELKALAAQTGAGDAIRFIGERRDIPDLLAAFDVTVQCSLSDNLAGTVEALLMARPLVVSDIPGFADTVQHEVTGLVVPPDDPDALADALVRLLRDRPLGERLGEQGRRHVSERFTLDLSVAGVERVLASRRPDASKGYRTWVSAARAAALPFRLLPVELAVYRAMRQHGFSASRYVGQRLVHAAWRAVTLVRKPRVSADPT
jgi:glycosyltransferase involved in cell wall biosynthesis